MQFTYQTIVSGSIDYLFILFFCLVGAIVKDAYNTITEKDFKINVKRILISATVSSILIFSLSDYLLSKISWKNLILPCFACGLTGFELLGKMIHLKFWVNLFLKDKYGIKDQIIDRDEEMDTKDKKEKNKG